MQENYIEAKIIDNEVAPQLKLAERVKKLVREGGEKKYYIQTFGCQQNEADSERLAGYCTMMGYTPADKPEDAKLILVNTCAVREHAEKKALSIIGQYKHIKDADPSVVIGVGGCMVTQKSRADKLKMSYPYVSFTFDTGAIHRIPELVLNALEGGKRSFVLSEEWKIDEGVPLNRSSKHMAWLSIMYGCNNFCTYCIVPYVRGRERSRNPKDIIREIEQLVSEGVVEVMLLGQNVNSYGKTLEEPMTFAELLREVEKIEGLQRIRFMTSHPKDLSDDLIQVMKESKKICRHLHLPLQAGSSRILQAMNRRYTKEQYLALAKKIRQEIPDISLTTDLIVGFPGETAADVDETIEVVKEVQYDNAFTFIYSKRTGTPAAAMENPVSEQEIKDNFDRLLKVVQDTARERVGRLQGQTMEALVEEVNEQDASLLTGRLSNNTIVHFPGDSSLIGSIVKVNLKECHGFYYIGEMVI